MSPSTPAASLDPRRVMPAGAGRGAGLAATLSATLLGLAAPDRAVAAPPPTQARLIDPTRAFVLEADLESAIALGAEVDPEGLAAPGWTTVSLPAEQDGPSAESLLASPKIAFVAPVLREPDGRMLAPTARLIVRFEPWVDDAMAAGILAAEDAGEIAATDAFGIEGAVLLETGRRDGREVISLGDRLAARPGVRYAEPEWFFHGTASEIPNDPQFPNAWGLHNVGQMVSTPCSTNPGTADVDLDGPEAWDLVAVDPELIVVVIDDGMQFDHPDLQALPALGADFTGQGGGGWPVHQCDNHGTAVAGCIAATRGNSLGTCGIASGVRVASARIAIPSEMCNSWTVNSTWVAAALQWSVEIGARITNTSWWFTESSVIADAYASSAAAGLLHVASSGNLSSSSVTFPSSLPSVVSVGAIRSNGQRASFSNRGTDLEFAAPGFQIVYLDRSGMAGNSSGDYGCASGTSFASPYVAGTAALMLSANPSLGAPQVRTLLKTATVDLGGVGWDADFGWGLPKASRAVRVAQRPADLDRNGHVDATDLTLLLGLWGGVGPFGDLDGDGAIGPADLTFLLASWGS